MIVESDENSIYYERIGSGGTPLVLVHGGNCDAAFMLPLARELSQFSCIALDRLGCRRSTALDEDTTAADQADAIAAVHRACTRDPAWVFGHSSGGNFALAYALQYPRAVEGLILMEPALYGAYPDDTRPEAIDTMSERVLPMFRVGDVDAGLQAFIELLGGVSAETLARLEELGLSEHLIEDAQAFAHDQPVVIEWCPTDEELNAIDIPVLLIKGTESPDLLTGIVDILGQKLRAETEVLAGCDHMAPQVAAGQVASVVSDFVTRHQ